MFGFKVLPTTQLQNGMRVLGGGVDISEDILSCGAACKEMDAF